MKIIENDDIYKVAFYYARIRYISDGRRIMETN